MADKKKVTNDELREKFGNLAERIRSIIDEEDRVSKMPFLKRMVARFWMWRRAVKERKAIASKS